ncbi:SPOR domain-containing protein [Pelagibius marinus]|uniref:SPOR domain-containing protein n=1 Tax=Pelagibius marinus TaxID=2762760 RepID=UPI001872AAFD|nr:SPOR domain-containing protein [Pelagibius marinus]
MSKIQGPSAKTAPGRAGAALLLWTLPALLGGCDAIYDDTKGWANRLEASILETAHELDEEPDAQEAEHYTPEVVETPRAPRAAMPPKQPPAAVPPQAVASQMARPASSAEPEGAVADAASGLLVPAPKAKAETTETAAKDGKKTGGTSKDAIAKNDGKKPQKAQGKSAKAAMPPLPKRKPQIAAVAPEKESKASSKEPSKEPAETPSQEPVQTAKTDNAHAMVLHLSSLRSEEAAKREWSNLKRDFPVALSGMEAEIRRTELGDKGTFYRVLAGPLPSRTAAREVCAEVKARNVKQYCRVLPSPPAQKSPS